MQRLSNRRTGKDGIRVAGQRCIDGAAIRGSSRELSVQREPGDDARRFLQVNAGLIQLGHTVGQVLFQLCQPRGQIGDLLRKHVELLLLFR